MEAVVLAGGPRYSRHGRYARGAVVKGAVKGAVLLVAGGATIR